MTNEKELINWNQTPRDLSCVVELLDEIQGILHEECFENYITDMKDIDPLAGYKERRLSVSGVVTKLHDLIKDARDGVVKSPHN